MSAANGIRRTESSKIVAGTEAAEGRTRAGQSLLERTLEGLSPEPGLAFQKELYDSTIVEELCLEKEIV